MWLVAAFLEHWFLYSLSAIVVLVLLRGIRYIPNTKVGLVEKRASRRGSVAAGIIALNGESGFQPVVLRGGMHYLLPWQFKVHIHPLAAQIQALAQAEAEKIRMLGEGEAKKVQALAGAEAERAARVGIAQAMAIDEQVRAYGGPRFQLTQQVMSRFAEAIEAARVDVVPKIVIHGGGANGTPTTGNVMEALLTLLLADRMGADAAPAPATPRSTAVEAVRSRIEQGLKDQK
jgi:uncharacterized membrane protein YqiK